MDLDRQRTFIGGIAAVIHARPLDWLGVAAGYFMAGSQDGFHLGRQVGLELTF